MQRLSRLMFNLFLLSAVAMIMWTLLPDEHKIGFTDHVQRWKQQTLKLPAHIQNAGMIRAEEQPSWSLRLAVFETGVYQFPNEYQSPAGLGYVIRLNSDSSAVVERVYPATFGVVRGMKEREGDYKTPHGLYRIRKEKVKSSNAELYGGYFLELNYPNLDDRRSGRTGSAIGIHGGRVRPTRGCIRILDEGWEMGDQNIREFNQLLGKDYRVAIVQNLAPSLKGGEGVRLGKEAFKRYCTLLSMNNPERELVLNFLKEQNDQLLAFKYDS